jgi:hypothetical protein
MKHAALLLILPLALSACDGTTEPDGCTTSALPLAGEAGAPIVVEVGLEVQTEGIVVVATATDPQGTEDLADVEQSIGVFPDARCTGTPIVLTDDLAGSGVEESFGMAVDAASNPALYAAISAAQTWPVEVDFRDRSGNRTQGRVLAQVIR